MANPIEVPLEEIENHIHSEEFERDYVTAIRDQAYAYLNKYLFSQEMDVNAYSQDEDYKQMYKRAVLFLSSSWYQNAEGSEPASVSFNSKVPGGLKMILETMRTPNL